MITLPVVIAIIAILAGMLLPALSSARAKAKAANCMSNLKQIGIALAQYEMDFNGLPYDATVDSYSNEEDFVASAKWIDPSQERWMQVFYHYFLQVTGYLSNEDFFHCPAYSKNEGDGTTGMNYSPNVAVFASNSTDRYPGAIYLGDGFATYRLRCKDWSFRWRHGAAKVGAGADEIGENTTAGNGNYLLADGSVQVKNASARATVCREDVAYLGTGGPLGEAYKDQNTDHPNCGASWE